MSIHTAEMSGELLFNHADDADEPLQIWLRRFEFSNRQIRYLLDENNHSARRIRRILTVRHPNLGIEQVIILKTPDEFYPAQYYITIRINPQLLIERQRTLHLFNPSEENNALLLTAFQEAMSTFDDNFAMTDFSTYNCARLDMTHDFRFETREQAQLFMRLIRRTSRYIRHREQRIAHNEPILDQSVAEANKSYKIICYDKQRQVRKMYRGVPDDEMELLLSQAENVVRFEIQCGKNKIYYLKKSNNFDSRNIWNYLNEEMIHYNLQKAYRETIGEGNFCYFHRVQQILNNADMRPSTRTNLYNFMRLISNAGCLSEGKRQFLRGRTISVNGNNVRVQGTEPTYYSRLRKLRELGINPIMIPPRLSSRYHIQELPNPYGELLI